MASTEVECRSMRAVTVELSWMIRILSKLQVPSILPILVKTNSVAGIHIAKNLVFHDRTKHINLDSHFAREKLHEGLISLSLSPRPLSS